MAVLLGCVCNCACTLVHACAYFYGHFWWLRSDIKLFEVLYYVAEHRTDFTVVMFFLLFFFSRSCVLFSVFQQLESQHSVNSTCYQLAMPM